MALSGCVIGLAGSFSRARSETIHLIESCGGRFTANVTRTTTHLLCTKDELDKFSSRVMLAVRYNVPIVAEAWVTDTVSNDTRQDESNYLLQVDAVALEQKIKECGDFFREKKEKKSKVSPHASPIREDEFDIIGSIEDHVNGSQSNTPISSANSTPTTTPKTFEIQRTSKRQRIAKDFGDVELPKPRSSSAKKAALRNDKEEEISDEDNTLTTPSIRKELQHVKRDVQYIKKELQALRNDITEVLQIVSSGTSFFFRPFSCLINRLFYGLACL